MTYIFPRASKCRRPTNMTTPSLSDFVPKFSERFAPWAAYLTVGTLTQQPATDQLAASFSFSFFSGSPLSSSTFTFYEPLPLSLTSRRPECVIWGLHHPQSPSQSLTNFLINPRTLAFLGESSV